MLIPHAPAILLGLGLLAQPIHAEEVTARECGLSLTAKAGLTTQEGEEVINKLEQYSVVKERTFLTMLYAVAYVESRFRENRRSHAGAVGILQVTPQAAEHIHMLRRLVGLRPGKVTIKILAQTPTNVNLGSAYLWLAYEEAGENWPGALAMYNGGYKQLTKLQRGDTVISETAQYVLKVMHLSQTCGL